MIIVERIDEGMAVLDEDGRLSLVPVSRLPDGAKEGSLLVRSGAGYALDPGTEAELRRQMFERTQRVIRKD